MSGDTSKLNMAAMKKAATTLGLKLPKGDPSVAAEAIRVHMRENYEDDKLAVCGICGYEAEETFDPCPYCGTDLGDPKEAKPKTKKPKTKKPKTKKPKTKKPKKKAVKAIAKPDPKAIADCDERIAKIKSFKKNIAEEAYSIGVEIKEIHDKNLWKAKGHKSFNAFCVAELDYTRVMAYKYMAMAGFKKEDAVLLGPSKADMITQAPKGKKAKLMVMAREGKSRVEMQTYLNKGKTPTAGKPEADGKITIVGRVKGDDITIPWTGDKSGKPTPRTTKGKHAALEVVSGTMLTIREDGDNLVLSFSKVAEE